MKNRPKVIAFIFARGGSKGLPGKNIFLLAGKPLITHTINLALNCERIDRVIVSTDDSDIADIARKAGAEVPFMRPPELASDEASEWLAWRHALRCLEVTGDSADIFISLPTTAPLRSMQDIEFCIDAFEKFNPDMVITVKEAERNPFFNMVKKNSDGLVELVAKGDFHRRQDAPIVYDMTTVAYVTTPNYIFRSESHFQGSVRAVLIPRERAVDIDTRMDMIVAQALLNNPISSEPPKLV